MTQEAGVGAQQFFSADPCHPLFLCLVWVLHGLQSLQGPPRHGEPPPRCVSPALSPATCLPYVISPNFGSHSSKASLSLLLSKFILFLIYRAFSSNKVMSPSLELPQGVHTGSFVFSTLLVVFKFLLVFLFLGGSAKLVRPRLLL